VTFKNLSVIESFKRSVQKADLSSNETSEVLMHLPFPSQGKTVISILNNFILNLFSIVQLYLIFELLFLKSLI